MTFLENIKTGVFWKSALKISIPFFIAVVIISLLFNNFSDIIKFDLEAIKAKNFSNGKWMQFLQSKVIISFIYGIWLTHRNINK